MGTDDRTAAIQAAADDEPVGPFYKAGGCKGAGKGNRYGCRATLLWHGDSSLGRLDAHSG
jgi:hypothetical protein